MLNKEENEKIWRERVTEYRGKRQIRFLEVSQTG